MALFDRNPSKNKEEELFHKLTDAWHKLSAYLDAKYQSKDVIILSGKYEGRRANITKIVVDAEVGIKFTVVPYHETKRDSLIWGPENISLYNKDYFRVL